jgi:Helix-turn-helix domain
LAGVERLAAISIGEYLKRQRLLRGITVEELSATTRIPLRSLERLEAGYFDGVSDGFVRGFVRTVALALGLDADDTVARMLDEPAASPWDRGGTGLWRKQALAVVALVVVTILALWVLRTGWNLLVGGPGSSRSREVVIWRDPVHQLAREHSGGLGSARESAAPGWASDDEAAYDEAASHDSIGAQR